jgi:hypothetical protein
MKKFVISQVRKSRPEIFGNLVFNRRLPLKDSWAMIEKKSGS